MAKPLFPVETQVMEFPRGESVSFDAQAFDDAVAAHGPVFVHWQAMPDPIGLQSKFDSRRPDGVNNTNAFNGWYYVKVGELQAILSGSTKEAKASTGGIVDSGIAQLTPSTRYLCKPTDNPRRVYLTPNDRFYLKDESIVVPRGELIEASIGGIDKTAFPCEEVLAIVDADGTQYHPQDYTVINGMIQWNDGRPRPSYNVEAGRGKVYSVKYLLKPFFSVHRLIHELRLMQVIDPGTGERRMIQANQSAIVQREYLFQNKVVDASAQDTTGAIPQPTEQ